MTPGDVEGGARRIQRSRAKGWRMPAGAVYVGRPSKWGNPFRIGWHGEDEGRHWDTAADVVEHYRYMLGMQADRTFAALRGHDLACWCPLDVPCHADVLLELALRAAPPADEREDRL